MINGAMSRPPLHQFNYTKEQMEQRQVNDQPYVYNGKVEKIDQEEYEKRLDVLAEYDPDYIDFVRKNPSVPPPRAFGGAIIYQPRRVPPGEVDTFQDYDKVFKRDDGCWLVYVRMEQDYEVHEVRSALADHSQTYFQDSARRYLNEGGEEYLNSYLGKAVNGVNGFAGKLRDFFGIDQDVYMGIADQIKGGIRELAQQIESGKGDRLDTLKTQITISGVDFSVNDLMKTIKAIDDITKPLKAPGHLTIEDSALYGISVSQMNAFASQNLNAEQAKLLTNVYSQRVQTAMAFQGEISSQLAEKNGLNSKDYEGVFSAHHLTTKGTASGAVFDLFASMDASSASAYQQSMGNALISFDTLMLQLQNANQPTDGYRELVNKALGSLQITSNGTSRTSFFSRYDDPKYQAAFARLREHAKNGTEPINYLRPLK